VWRCTVCHLIDDEVVLCHDDLLGRDVPVHPGCASPTMECRPTTEERAA
jgi:hypothetical protein